MPLSINFPRQAINPIIIPIPRDTVEIMTVIQRPSSNTGKKRIRVCKSNSMAVIARLPANDVQAVKFRDSLDSQQ